MRVSTVWIENPIFSVESGESARFECLISWENLSVRVEGGDWRCEVTWS